VAEGIVIAQLPTQATIAAEKPRRSWVMWTWVVVGVVLAALVAIAAFTLIIGKQVAVPTITGMTLPEAQNVVTAAGLKINDITTQTGSNAPDGSIIAQTPGPGVSVRDGSSIAIVIAAIRPKVSVPNLVGLSTAEAGRTITSAGLVAQISRRYSDATPQDTVIDQIPPAGQSVLVGSSVNISISLGPQSTTETLPDLAGMSQTDAVNKVVSLGLTAHVSNSFSSTVAAGQVIEQVPAAGQSVAPGTAIGINLSAGPPTGNTVTSPNLVGQTSTNAIGTLGGLGLTYSTVMWDGTGAAAETVVSQLPKSGEQVSSGGAVVVFVSSGK
jgi:serine/threonine-protein kinase